MAYRICIRICFFVLLSITLPAFAQTPAAGKQELLWAMAHPVAAIRVKQISRQCDQQNRQNPATLFLDSFSAGGQADAYRHCFYMAAYAQKIKVQKLRKLGEAHERTNYEQFLRAVPEDGAVPDSLSSVMDLMNNELGFRIGSQHPEMPLDALQRLVIRSIQQGEAVIMKRDRSGLYLTCEGAPIHPGLYTGRWNIPKCLVSSATAVSGP
jgi:hypothetical protein